jgi:hypothetical protein
MEKRNKYKDLFEKYDKEKPHAIPMNRWENNIKIYLESV